VVSSTRFCINAAKTNKEDTKWQTIEIEKIDRNRREPAVKATNNRISKPASRPASRAARRVANRAANVPWVAVKNKAARKVPLPRVKKEEAARDKIPKLFLILLKSQPEAGMNLGRLPRYRV